MAPRRWKQYRPDGTPEPDGAPAQPPTHRPYTPPKQPKPVRSLEERTVRRTGGPSAKLIVGGLVAVAAATTLIVALGGGDDDAAAGQPQTDQGFDALVAALREERDSTLVRRAVIYPEYASVSVPYKPDDPSDERQLDYYWDGELNEPSKTTGDEEAFDLTSVESSVLDALCPQVEKLVEDPTNCYLIIEKPDADDETPAWISAYASNEFNQTAYIEYDLNGTQVEVHPAS
ncbi:hypothetical protein [Nocardioides nitrophenolicus]|uniref:hypothetical protein n=1 Tax=Nocardioides nitrophenolicus TaxID=60489 RepID=UPI001960E01E|nr:hypothetical protein [Nocardioides nitrophenolicus]MBM7520472.1 hypothetical protein [Nocardioides nitrophenolicus]